MKNLTSHKVRSLFLIGGVSAMMGATMMVPQAARADKAQNYKYGAAALGVLGVILAAKGKTLPAVVAGAGAYYAYEKGKDAKNEERYNDRYGDHRWNDNRYDRNDHRDNSHDYYGDRYDNDNRYDWNNNRYDRKDNRYDNRYDSNNYYGNRYDSRDNRNERYDRNDNRDYRYGDHSYSVR